MVLTDDKLDLRPVGFFEELGLGAHYIGRIRDAIQERAAPNEQNITSYLNDCYVLLDVPEAALDVLSGNERIIGVPSLVSDGTWVWRRDLAYYVAHYHLKLPAEFIEHVTRHEYTPPILSEEELERAAEKALSYF